MSPYRYIELLSASATPDLNSDTVDRSSYEDSHVAPPPMPLIPSAPPHRRHHVAPRPPPAPKPRSGREWKRPANIPPHAAQLGPGSCPQYRAEKSGAPIPAPTSEHLREAVPLVRGFGTDATPVPEESPSVASDVGQLPQLQQLQLPQVPKLLPRSVDSCPALPLPTMNWKLYMSPAHHLAAATDEDAVFDWDMYIDDMRSQASMSPNRYGRQRAVSPNGVVGDVDKRRHRQFQKLRSRCKRRLASTEDSEAANLDVDEFHESLCAGIIFPGTQWHADRHYSTPPSPMRASYSRSPSRPVTASPPVSTPGVGVRQPPSTQSP